MTRVTTDISILGSGFSGSVMALILDKLGLKTVLIDKATHPRFAIGESSTPIADMILRSLADTYDLPRLRPLSTYGTWQDTYPHLVVGRKRGFSYFQHRPNKPFIPDPLHRNELLVAASNSPYYCDTHWLRADVDAFLAEEVRRTGIPFFDKTAIRTLHHDDTWHLSARRGQDAVEIKASFVIDATGAVGVVPQALGLGAQEVPYQTHSRAIFAHFKGVRPWHGMMKARGGIVTEHPYPCDEAALHHILDGAWLWVLRFNNDVVSAGLVLDERRYPLDPTRSAEEEWTEWFQRYPALQHQFDDASLLTPPGRLIRTGRLQRRVARATGSTWAALPYTAGFIDPLHSTGIAHSLSGVERLTGLLKQHWGSPTLHQALQDYEAHLFRELALIDTLVAVCYASFGSFRLFTASTMLYFAAVITYEQQRAHMGTTITEPFNRLFLCAGDTALRGIVEEALVRLSAMDTPPTPQQVNAYEQFVEEAIRPYNTVGLFHPPAPNMYHHTAAPLQT